MSLHEFQQHFGEAFRALEGNSGQGGLPTPVNSTRRAFVLELDKMHRMFDPGDSLADLVQISFDLDAEDSSASATSN